MKVQLLTPNIQSKLSFLNKAVSPKSQLPVLQNILLEAKGDKLRLSSTDLEIGIEAFVPCKIDEEGETTVPARLFTELVNSLTDEVVTLTAEDNTLHVQTKRTKSTFQTISADEFPKLYEEKGELLATLPAKDIKREFSSVVFAASADTTRPALFLWRLTGIACHFVIIKQLTIK
jgi:DNA polymerase III subunit beta